MKELALYAVVFFTLMVAIVIPVEWGFWWGFMRGVFLAIFIHLIPVWVRTMNNRGRDEC